MAMWESLLWPDPAMTAEQLGARRYAACLMLARLTSLLLSGSREDWRRMIFLAEHLSRSPI